MTTNLKISIAALSFTGAVILAGCGSNAPSPSGGKVVFGENCAPCHGEDARGKLGPSLHNPSLSKVQITATIRNGRGRMPAFDKTLSAAQQEEVADYIVSLNNSK